jgi:hypothetical protein
MAIRRDRERGVWIFVAGSVGVALIVAGCAVFLGQVIVGLGRKSWPSLSMAWLAGDLLTHGLVPLVQPWTGMTQRELNELVLQILDALPLSLCLIGVGAATVYKATRR